MESISLPSIPIDATPLIPLVHITPIEPLGRVYSVPSYSSTTNHWSEWIPTYMVQNDGDLPLVNCEVHKTGFVYSCRCEISHTKFGTITCESTNELAATSSNGLGDCRVSIAPKLAEVVLATAPRRDISPYCQSYISSGTDLVIPIHTIRKKPYQKGLGYYYTPTWMFDAPDWAFPMYSVGDNLLALCKAHLKESHLSCDCTIYGTKEMNPVIYCPSRNTVPLSGPLNSHEPRHCELFLPLDESDILTLKPSEERLDVKTVSEDMRWPCSATIIAGPSMAPLIDEGRSSVRRSQRPRKRKEGADEFTESMVIDRSETLATKESRGKTRKTPDEVRQKDRESKQKKRKSNVLDLAAAEGLDTSLKIVTLKDQLKELEWERSILAEAVNLKPEERDEFIRDNKVRHQEQLQELIKKREWSKKSYIRNREKKLSKMSANRRIKAIANEATKRKSSNGAGKGENDGPEKAASIDSMHEAGDDKVHPYASPLDASMLPSHFTASDFPIFEGIESSGPLDNSLDLDHIFDDHASGSHSGTPKKSPTESENDMTNLFQGLPSPE